MRHVASSENTSVFLTAEFERFVYTWDLYSFKLVSKFESVLDFGGKRLAISNDGKLCVAAAYNRKGICLYDVATGVAIWNRKDIKHTQAIKFSLNGDMIYVNIDDKYLLSIDSATGGNIKKDNKMSNIYQNPYNQYDCFLKGDNILKFGTAEIKSPTFAFLDIAPTDLGIAVSAVGNNLMFFNFNNEKIWEIIPQEGKHF